MSFLLLFSLIDWVGDLKWINKFARWLYTAHTKPSKTLPNAIHSHKIPCVAYMCFFVVARYACDWESTTVTKTEQFQTKKRPTKYIFISYVFNSNKKFIRRQESNKIRTKKKKKLALALYTVRGKKKLFTKSVARFAPFVNLELCAFFSVLAFITLYFALREMCVSARARVRSRTYSCL